MQIIWNKNFKKIWLKKIKLIYWTMTNLDYSWYWYGLLIYSGKEKEVVANIKDEFQKNNFQKKVKKLLFIPKFQKRIIYFLAIFFAIVLLMKS